MTNHVIEMRCPSSTLAAAVAMVLSAACWGLATVMSKGALTAFSPPVLLTLQLVASVTFLWGAVAAASEKVSLDTGARWAALSGLLEPGLAYAFTTFGLMLTTAGNASVIGATEPLLIVILAWLLFQDAVGTRKIMAILAAMAGVGMVTGANGGAKASLSGDALVLLGTLFAALYVVFSSRLVTRIAPLSLAALQQSAGLVLALVLLVAWLPLRAVQNELSRAEPELVALALLSGIVQYALAFWLYLVGLRRLSASTAGLFLTLIPVFGLVGAAIFLGETVGVIEVLGAAIILAAVASSQRASTI